jgi:hypothetical protein
MSTFICTAADMEMLPPPGYDDLPDVRRIGEVAVEQLPKWDIRSAILFSYDWPRALYQVTSPAIKKIGDLGALNYYHLQRARTGRARKVLMDVEILVEKWAKVITGLAIAHDKDEADRYEASVEEILTPILAAPIKQVREFYPKLLARLKSDPKVPFLVWRAYEVWVETAIAKATDEGIKELKTELAREISALVEQDVKEQLPEALIRALQWRSGETLAEVKEAVIETKANGGKVKLRGKESCLFMVVEASATRPEVCVQI